MSILDNFPRPPDWTSEALCAQADPSIFFPPKGGRITAARRICARCPVAEPCLEYGLEHDDAYGIYGGMTVEQRARIKRKRAA